MSIKTEKGTHTWCEKCGTIQLVQKVKHYIDYSHSPNIICLIGCVKCRDEKIKKILNDN